MKHIDEANEKARTAESRKGAAAESGAGHVAGAHRYTYLDALRGKVPVPQGANGATIFRVLMVGGMVTFMVTFNGIRHTGLDFLMQSHWLYPLMFCVAFLVRTFYADKALGVIAPRTVLKWFSGTKLNVAMTALNVLLMAPVMCALAALLLNGTQNYLLSYLTTLPMMMPVAFAVSHFVVGPAAKLLFNNRISPAGGLRFLNTMGASTDSLTRLLGF